MSALTLLPFLIAPFAAAQNSQPGDVVALGTFAPAGAAHGEVAVAMNDIGDVFFAWEAAVDAPGNPGADLTRIEGAYLRRISNASWRLFPTEVLGEADPAALGSDQVFLGGDTCSAPDVISLGDHFVVAWTRRDASGASDARIECATIEVPAAGASITHGAALGVGHALAAIAPEGAAGQVDLLHGDQLDFLATYVTHVGMTSYAGGMAHDFHLETREVALASIAAAPIAGNAAILDDTLAFDDRPASVPHAAAVEPSTAWDSFGNLVVAYSDYRSADRIGFGFTQRGRLEIARFDGSSFAPKNSQLIQVRGFDNLQRDADLVRSAANSTLSLTVTAEDISFGTQNQVGHFELDYPPVSNAAITDYAVALTSWNPNQTEALQHRGVRAALVDLDFSGTAALAYKRPGKAWVAISKPQSIAPTELALGHLETDPIQPADGWLTLAMVGTAGADPRVHFMIAKL